MRIRPTLALAVFMFLAGCGGGGDGRTDCASAVASDLSFADGAWSAGPGPRLPITAAGAYEVTLAYEGPVGLVPMVSISGRSIERESSLSGTRRTLLVEFEDPGPWLLESHLRRDAASDVQPTGEVVLTACR